VILIVIVILLVIAGPIGSGISDYDDDKDQDHQ
jgi:hypothetical protein